LHIFNVDFSGLNASGALCEDAIAYRCNFWESQWYDAQGDFKIYESNVSYANFAGATSFLFFYSYTLSEVPARGLTDEQAQSITGVSTQARDFLYEPCSSKHFRYTIAQEERSFKQKQRISKLEETVAGLAEQVAKFSQRQQ